jgi:hydrogenase expression/formation protein HypC
MCLELPALVLEVDADGVSATVTDDDRTGRALLLAVDSDAEPVKPGDWLLVHAGVAVQRLSPAEATDLLELIREARQADESSPS